MPICGCGETSPDSAPAAIAFARCRGRTDGEKGLLLMGRWTRTEVEGFSAWRGAAGAISLCVIPGLGSKIISLRNEATGREWLWRSGKPLGNEGYGTSFSAGDESGWDEMFPGISVSSYPDQPWQGAIIPNHGEVWTLPWEDDCLGETLRCRVEGRAFPYTLEKIISFASEKVLRIDYTLTNRSEFPFRFMWAAHPLLRADAGMRLRVPGHLSEVEVSYSEGSRLGKFGDMLPWPVIHTADGAVDLSVIEAADSGTAEKYYFAGRLKEGFAEITDPATGEGIRISFPVEQVPYLAVWANYGGYGGHSHFAIEPATGRMDDLRHAIQAGEAAVVEGNGTYRWFMEVAVS